MSASIKVFSATLQKKITKSHSSWNLFYNETKINSDIMNSMVFENEIDNETSDMISLNNTNKNSFKTLKSLSTT